MTHPERSRVDVKSMVNLPPGLRQQLRDAARGLHDFLPVLDVWELCGHDCQEFRRDIDYLRQRLERYEQYWFDNSVSLPSSQ